MGNLYKKIVNLLLISAFLFCLLLPAFSACNKTKTMADAAYGENETLQIAVLSDTHYTSPTLMDENSVESFPEKFYDTKSFVASRAIIKSTIDQIVESGVKYILISGDLCDRHDIVSHTEFAEVLRATEKKGVQVFVAPGNHDVSNESQYEGHSYLDTSTTPVRVPDFYNPVLGEPRDEGTTIEGQFKDIYSEFGYDESLEEKGLNYTADLGDNHRLIVLDNCSVDLELATIDWAEEQAKAAVAAGRTPILMMHKPIDNMFGAILNLTDSATTARGKQLMNRLSDAGVKFALTGHNHANNIVELKKMDEDGNEVVAMLDIMTSSLIHTDHSYRVLRFSENYVVGRVLGLEEVNSDYLPEYMSKDEREKIDDDLKKYSYNFLEDYITQIISSASIKTALAEVMYGEGVVAPVEFDTFVEDAIVGFATMPFYGEKNSVEALYKKYGATLPESDFESLVDLVAATLAQIFEGEEDRERNASLTEMIGASIKGLIVSAIDKGFFGLSKDFETVNKTILDATCTRLLTKGEFELLESKILHNLLQLPIIEKVNELLGGLISIPNQAGTQDAFGNVISLLTVVEVLIDMKVEPYFESRTVKDEHTEEERKIYSGVFFSDKCLKEQLFEGFEKGLIHDSDVADRNFVLDVRTFANEKLS